jgi:hypothetical protein
MQTRHRPTVRTGHVAPLDEVGREYVAHIEGNTRVLDDAPAPFGSIAAAVEWARARAAIVVVRVAGETFRRSAGDEPPPWDQRMPRWPAA